MRNLLCLMVAILVASVAGPFILAMPGYLSIRSEVLSAHPISEPLPLYARAVLAAEDPKFLERTGVQYLSDTYGPILTEASQSSPRYGSIAYQLIRTTEPRPQGRGVVTKMALYVMVEMTLPRPYVFSAYLENVYLGGAPGGPVHGIDQASRFLFAKPKEELTAPEAALIAGLIKSPAMYSPRQHPDQAKMRRNWVLKRMLEAGQIDQAEYERSLNDPVPSNA